MPVKSRVAQPRARRFSAAAARLSTIYEPRRRRCTVYSGREVQGWFPERSVSWWKWRGVKFIDEGVNVGGTIFKGVFFVLFSLKIYSMSVRCKSRCVFVLVTTALN